MTTEEFGEVLTTARLASLYPDTGDFALQARISHRSCQYYETGVQIPSIERLEQIIRLCNLPSETASRLYELRDAAKARRMGLSTQVIPHANVDLTNLASKIQKEIGYELKRCGVNLTPKTKRVCMRRIKMILSDALEKT